MSFTSFLKDIENIGKDIIKGVEIAAPIVGAFVPAVGPILAEVAQIVSALEAKGQTLTSEQLTSIVNTIASANAMKQSVAGSGSS